MQDTSDEAEFRGSMLALDRSTGEVDRIFAAVGSKLGQGLSVFEALSGRLRAISADLAGDDMAATRRDLAGVVAELRSFSGGLTNGIGDLERIGRQGETASRAIDRLSAQIRVVTAIARCARIEEAFLSIRGRGVFIEIGGLVGQALESIQRFGRDHAHLTRMLGPAMRSQRDFAAKYTLPLTSLAAELETSLDHIEQCRRRSVTLTADASRQAARIGDAVSGGLVALQCGDSTRQRLEHSRHTMSVGHDIATMSVRGACPRPGHLTRDERAAVLTALPRVAAAQLRDTAEEMDRDTGQVEQALGVLSEEVEAVIGLGGSCHRGDAPHIASLLAGLEAKLSQASEMIGRCRTAGAGVDQVTHAVTQLVGAFGEATASLSGTVRDIVLMGMNAGLYASRLGDDGRSMVAVARELKAAADQIGEHAATLLPVLDEMQGSLAGMTEQTAARTGRLACLDGTIHASLATMKASGVKLGDALDALATDSAAFAASLDDARAAFAGAHDIRRTIIATAERQQVLSGARAVVHGTGLPGAAEFLNREILPRYTIAIERRIFHDVLGALGMGMGTEADAVPETGGEVEALDASWEF